MEILALSIAIAIVLICFVHFVFVQKSDDDYQKNLPPGSFGWPIIGETILFGKPEKFVGDRMKKYSPDIFKTKILGEKVAVICGPNGHKFLFANEQKYFTAFRPHAMQRLFGLYQSKAPPLPQSAADQMQQGDEDERFIRQAGFLRPEALARYLGKMDSISHQLLQAHWQGKNEVVVYPMAKTITLALSWRFFLGTDNPERLARLVDQFDDIILGLHSITVNVPGTIFYKANRAAAAIRKDLLAVIKEKKAEMATGVPMRDILSHAIFATYPSGKHMPEAEIAGKILGLIIAGYSTVATTITFLMKYVGERPDIFEKIRAEQLEIAASKKPGELLEWKDMQKMKYSWNVICETMRLNPPLQGTFREVLTDFTYAGYTIPKGWKVYWTVSTTNKNPAYFKHPDQFDPSRYEGEGPAPYTYVPFGGGPRMCPGKEYARLAVLAFVYNVFKMYKWEILFPDEKTISGMMPALEKGLPIRLHPL